MGLNSRGHLKSCPRRTGCWGALTHAQTSLLEGCPQSGTTWEGQARTRTQVGLPARHHITLLGVDRPHIIEILGTNERLAVMSLFIFHFPIYLPLTSLSPNLQNAQTSLGDVHSPYFTSFTSYATASKRKQAIPCVRRVWGSSRRGCLVSAQAIATDQ